MRLLFILLMMLFSFTGTGQTEFAPVGAKWYYIQKTFERPEIRLHEYTSEKDTIIFGTPCKKIIGVTYAAGPDTLKTTSLFISEYNDSVCYFNSLYNDFILLYDFSAQQGDTLSFPVPDPDLIESDSASFKVVVDTIEQILFGEDTLLFFKLQDLAPENWSYYGGYVKGIGSLYSLFFPERTFRTASEIVYLSCYEDERGFKKFTEGNCTLDIINKTNDIFSVIDWQIYPNPTSSELRLQILSETLIYPINYEVLNPLGKIFLQGNVKEGGVNIIPISFLQPGSYIIKIFNHDITSAKIFIVQ